MPRPCGVADGSRDGSTGHPALTIHWPASCRLFHLPPARGIGEEGQQPERRAGLSPCRSAPSARPQRSLIRRGRALGAFLQRTGSCLLRCAAQRHEPLRVPCVAVRGGRSGPAGVPDRTSGTFRPGRSPVEKPGRPSRTGWVQPRQRHAGCRSLWLFLLGKQEKVTRAAAAVRKPAAGEPAAEASEQKRKSLDYSRSSPLRGRPTGVLCASRWSCLRRSDEREGLRRKAIAHWVRSYKRADIEAGFPQETATLQVTEHGATAYRAGTSAPRHRCANACNCG